MRICVPGVLFVMGCASANAGADKPLAAVAPPPSLTAIDAGDQPGGDADFRLVAARAASPYDPETKASLENFLARHPYHHQRPAAVAMLAGVLLMQREPATAKALLDQNLTMLPGMERDFFLGLEAGQLKEPARALDLLKQYLGADPPPRMGGLPDADVRRLLRITLAESLASVGRVGDGIDQLELYANIEGNLPAERAFALRRAEELAAGLGDAAALDALVNRRGLYVRAVLGNKGVAALKTKGDTTAAARLDQETMAVRRQLGLEAMLPSAVAPNPARVGLVVPLSGSQSRLGEVVLRGAELVTSAAMHATERAEFHLMVRDAAAPPERSALGGGTAAGILSLAREEKVIGVVTTPDAHAAEMAAREGVPLVLLDERVGPGQTTAFSLIHSADIRAMALAQQALALGARRFAILAPDNASGKRLAAAFRRAVEQGGGTVTGQISYPPNATTFASEIAELRRAPFEALFVPEDAGRFELIAPALAVADVWPRSPRMAFSSSHTAAVSGPGRRECLLLSTALGVSAKFLGNINRYVQGALFCPGFYPADDTRSASFVGRFRAAYGTAPTATDAYGYDAIFLLRNAVQRGAKTRADLVRVLGSQTFEGLTGDIRFGRDRTRIDPPLIYVVEGDTMRALK
jgi:branched-chain amino acid transport system substrate-binding protein